MDAFLNLELLKWQKGSSNSIHAILYDSFRLSISNRGEDCSLESLHWNAMPCCGAWRLEAKEQSLEYSVMQKGAIVSPKPKPKPIVYK